MQLKALVIVLLALAHGAHAEELVLIGHVQRLTLVPAGVGECPPRCPLVVNNPDGTQTVCISNFGGCETVDIKVDRVLSGAVDGTTHTLKQRIGEWGPRFPYTDRPVLISKADGIVTWSVATARNGKTFIDPKRVERIGNAPTNAVAADEHGLVAVEDVLEHARSRADGNAVTR